MKRTSSLLLLALSGCANTTTRTESGATEVVTVRLDYNNAHAVTVPGGTILVDSGLERDAAALVEGLSSAGIDPADLALIILTHGHADHAGGARWLRARYGTPILAGQGDLHLVEAGHNDTLCPTDRTARGRLEEAQAETFEPFTPDILVSAPLDLAELDLAKLDLAERDLAERDPAEIRLRGTVTPVGSHTAGSLVLDLGDVVFAGDLLRGSVVGSAAETHYFQCEPAAAVADVRAALDTTDAPLWFVGHFGPLPRAAVETFVAAN